MKKRISKILCFGKPQKGITFASSGNIEKDFEKLKELKEEKVPKTHSRRFIPNTSYIHPSKPTPTQLVQNPPKHFRIIANEFDDNHKKTD